MPAESLSAESLVSVVLSLIVFLPALGALVLLVSPGAFPKDKPDASRLFSLFVTVVVFLLTLYVAMPSTNMGFKTGVASLQNAFSVDWIPSYNIYYFMGLDGVSFPLMMLTSFLSVLAMWASWSITKQVRGYCILFLLLETGMLGVFLALDFFLFYVFWEVMLLPMYFLIGVWGGPRREYAAIKFFLYTLVGSVFMLIAILMLYFASDLHKLNDSTALYARSDGTPMWADVGLPESLLKQLQPRAETAKTNGLQIAAARTGTSLVGATVEIVKGASDKGEKPDSAKVSWSPKEKKLTIAAGSGANIRQVAQAINADPQAGQLFVARAGFTGERAPEAKPATVTLALPGTTAGGQHAPLHTFNIIALSKLGQYTDLFDKPVAGLKLQTWAFWLLFIGFVIKVPSVPLHTWLPDAHVEAPTPISMILAGVLLKMGGYGIIRICFPICPMAAYEGAYVVCAIGVLSMVYGAFAAMAQKDFKRLVAYSSVSHMGYVVLGFGVWSAKQGTQYNIDYWAMGISGAMFQMIAHGISSAGMFFLVGVVYDRVHHRNLNEFGGLFAKMPTYAACSVGIFFAGLGLPGLCGFIGEVLVVFSSWKFSPTLAVISAGVVILTAGYILWTIQRVYLGAEYKGPHGDHLSPMTAREVAIAAPLLVLAVLLGVFPHHTALNFMTPTLNQTAKDLSAWTQHVYDAKRPVESAAGELPVGQAGLPELGPAAVSAADSKPGGRS